MMLISQFRSPPQYLNLRRFFCKSSISSPDMEWYREAFSRRMATAGIKPHNRIALGVSGGADSMALCVLTMEWKTRGGSVRSESNDFIDGLLGIIVDHKLRPESSEEAKLVSERVSKIGIRCKIVPCDWSDGKPKQGHLEEAARDMRYHIFQNVCIHHQISVLLVGHQADDQAELFILRLSRNSGVLGLAGMAFASELFPSKLDSSVVYTSNQGILLVRPLLQFSKEDMYKICQGCHQEWVEDPTNQSSVFARNRIRSSLRSFSCLFKSELNTLISACRLTRSFVENACHNMMEQSVTITDHGYAIIDLEKLNTSTVEDLCLSKFLAVLLQFISQRHRPVRGSVSQLLLDYIHNIPCKTALTAAGCYLCPAPGSKGMKVLVCCSLNSPDPSGAAISQWYYCKEHSCLSTEIDEIIKNAKLYRYNSISTSAIPFLHVKSSSGVLEEAKKLTLIGDSTYRGITSLQIEENKHFNTQTQTKSDHGSIQKSSPNILGIPLHSRQICHFMSRFLVSWQFCKTKTQYRFSSDFAGFSCDSSEENQPSICESCVVQQKNAASIRAMVDADWLHLANLAKRVMSGGRENPILFANMTQSCSKNRGYCSEYTCLSAQRALIRLKSIPLSARRALPVLVDSEGLLLSVPSIGFQSCPFLLVEAVCRPRVPLGGGFSSYS